MSVSLDLQKGLTEFLEIASKHQGIAGRKFNFSTLGHLSYFSALIRFKPELKFCQEFLEEIAEREDIDAYYRSEAASWASKVLGLLSLIDQLLQSLPSGAIAADRIIELIPDRAFTYDEHFYSRHTFMEYALIDWSSKQVLAKFRSLLAKTRELGRLGLNESEFQELESSVDAFEVLYGD